MLATFFIFLKNPLVAKRMLAYTRNVFIQV